MTNLEVGRRFHETYRDGDVDGFLACLAPGWRVHEADGSASSTADLVEITRLHAVAFPDKTLTFVHEVQEGDLVAQFVRYEFVHTGRYLDLEPAGRTVEFAEMIFHRFVGDRIAESWRLTYPFSMRAALRGD
jgi:predicted ester cyclase